MKGIKRVYGKVLERTAEGVTVKTRKRAPVFVPFSELARKDVSVIVWKNGQNGLAPGCSVDVCWWDGPVDYDELFGVAEGVPPGFSGTIESPDGEELPF